MTGRDLRYVTLLMACQPAINRVRFPLGFIISKSAQVVDWIGIIAFPLYKQILSAVERQARIETLVVIAMTTLQCLGVLGWISICIILGGYPTPDSHFDKLDRRIRRLLTKCRKESLTAGLIDDCIGKICRAFSDRSGTERL